MKKTILMMSLILGSIFSCSTEGDGLENCRLVVWGMNSQNSDGNIRYWVDYGENEADITTVEVSKETFDYYLDLVEDGNDDNDCWIGRK